MLACHQRCSGNNNFLGSAGFRCKISVMKYFIIAGEQSGDLHGSNLVMELINHDGEMLKLNAGAVNLWNRPGLTLLMHYKKTAFMGFLVVRKNLGAIKKNLVLCKQHISEFKPDVVILIDYPGFNFRIAEFARKSGYRVFYYISPKALGLERKQGQKSQEVCRQDVHYFPV